MVLLGQKFILEVMLLKAVTLKNLFVFVSALVVSQASFHVSAQQLPISAADYSCSQLQVLLRSEGQLAIKGLLGTTPVHAGFRSCGFRTRPVPATWCTNDKLFCSAGYTCQIRLDEDD